MVRIGIALGVAVLLGVGLASLPVEAQSASSGSTSASARVQTLRIQGWELAYNLDYPQALLTLEEAIALDPNEPALHRLAASIVWMGILFESGAVLVDDYLGQAEGVVDRPKPSPTAERTFRNHIARALDLAERRLRDDDNDPDAHFQLGSSSGMLATYTATVEGRVLGSFGNMRRAFREHEKVLALSPSRKDAGLLPGMYRYSIAGASLPLRLVARLGGITGSLEEGVRQVEAAAAYPSEAQTGAMLISVVIYNREKRYDDALRIIRDLQRRYPRNRLLWLESGTTALRAGRAPLARTDLERGLAMLSNDSRPLAFGEEARWRLTHGMALLSLDRAEAARQLRVALTVDGPEWVRGRTHAELGKVADLEGRRAEALEEYRTAVRLCRAQHDDLCSNDASRLMQTPHR